MSRFRALVLVAALVSFGAAAPASAEEDTRIPTRVVLLSDHTQPVKTWADLPVRVRVEDGAGNPIAGRPVTFWDDSYMRWRCCGPPPKVPTDADGIASIVLNLDGNGANPVRVAVLVHSTDTHQKTSLEWYQPLVGRDTTVTATLPASLRSGAPVPVTVSVTRDEWDAGCIVGAVVRLTLHGADTLEGTATIPNDGTCRATVELAGDLTPGDYILTATTGHEGWRRTDEPGTTRRSFRVAWEHTFTDSYGRGTVLLNDLTDEYRVVLADGRDSGIRGAGLAKTGVSGTLPIWKMDLAHSDAHVSANGTFYSTGSFGASGSIAGQPWSLSR